MIAGIRAVLRDPRLGSVDLDSPEASRVHQRILQSKPLLREIYEDFHRQCHDLDRLHFGATPGRRIEIGAGAGRIALTSRGAISSDVKILPFMDLVLSGSEMPFADRSLRAVYAINVFHHLPDVRKFFRELLRTLHSGGGAVLIEPYYGPLARWLYRRLHDSESFDMEDPEWVPANPTGPMSRANQALAHNVFVRDRERWAAEFPGLELVSSHPHTQARYFLSGGLNYRPLLPGSLSGLARLLERALAPADPILALQHTLVVRKRIPGREGGGVRFTRADRSGRRGG